MGIIALIISNFTFNRLSATWDLFPPYFVWIPNIIIIFLLLEIIINKKVGLNKKIIWLIFIFGLMSVFFNDIYLLKGLLGINDLFRYILVFYIILCQPQDEKFYKNIIYLFIFLGIIQIPLIIYQSKIYTHVDYISGTLGMKYTGVMVLFITSLISIVFNLYINKGNILYLLLGFILAITPILGSARVFPLFFIILIISLVYLSLKYNKKKLYFKRAMSIILISTLISIITIFTDYISTPAIISEYINRRQHMIDQQIGMDSEKIARFEAISYVAKRFIFADIQSFLIGKGPGSLRTHMFRIENDTPFFLSTMPEFGGTGELPKLLIEWGGVGFLLFIILFLDIFKVNMKLIRDSHIDKFWRSISIAFIFIIPLTVIGEAYTDAWNTSYALFFWIIAGIIVKIEKETQLKG